MLKALRSEFGQTLTATTLTVLTLASWCHGGTGNDLNRALKLAGANATELKRAVAVLPAEHRPAAEFLIRNMPDVDLAQMSAALLKDNVEFAYRTRNLFPWNRTIPDDVFLHYVLPYRVTQEPISDWRAMFYDSLYPRVKSCTTMTQLALEVNKWCGERVKYKPNAPRDQGPLQTLKSGWGRCEEMVIVHICACRAMGLPAREAYTPYWSTGESNHAWSEVWIDGRWNYMGAAEPAPLLNNAWFDKSVQRAALVMNVSFGVPDKEPNIYRKGQGYAVINNTSNYTRTGIITVRVTKSGKPQRDAQVCFSVFNFGALRPIAKLLTERNGCASIPMGEGDYFVSAGTAQAHCIRTVTCTADAIQRVTVDLSRPDSVPEHLWLWYKPLP
jgi:hypothetical protein